MSLVSAARRPRPATGAAQATGIVLATAVISTGLTGVPRAAAHPAQDPPTFAAGVGAYYGEVSDGSCFVDARVTGGAGGHNMAAGSPPVPQPGANGAAARISARFSVVPGESFEGVVGGGGRQVRTAGSNGGGSGGTTDTHPGAGGGGWSSLRLDGDDVIVAGGGGGSGGGHSMNEGGGGDAGLPTGAGVTAGTSGTNGRDLVAATTVGGGAGGGREAPGAGGVNSATPDHSGSAGIGRTGGNGGSDATPDSGGGGGGGWFGGGGGASTTANGMDEPVPGGVTGAGGGGGASFVAATSPDGGPDPSGISSTAVGERDTAGAGQDGDVVLDFVPCDYDLAVTKTVDDSTPAPGETVTWTVTVTNNGPDPMTRGDEVTLDDSLPGPGVKTIESVSVSGGGNDRGLARRGFFCYAAAGDPMPATLTCSRPYADSADTSFDVGYRGLDPGETLTVVYTEAIPTGTPSGATYSNVAEVTDRGSPRDNIADATITVTAGPPVATDDARNTPFGTTVTLPATDNDSPSDPGTPLVPGATVFTSADATDGGKTLVTAQGTWQVNPSGTVTFTPAPGYAGTTPPVEYRITDQAGGTDTAALTVTVRPGPQARPDTGTTPEDTTITVALLPNDTPGLRADGSAGGWDPGTVVFTSPNATNGGRTLQVPGQGVYTIDPVTGAVTFDPEPGFTGQATPVGYQVTDSNGNATRSTLTVNVAPDDSFDLALKLRAVSGKQAKVGDQVRYRLQVSNKGPDAAPGPVRLTDKLPHGLELVSAKGKGWKCTVRRVTDTVSCVRKRGLGADRAAPPVSIVAVATKASLGRAVNIAKVRVAGESLRSNNRDRESITVVPAQLPSTGYRLRPPGVS